MTLRRIRLTSAIMTGMPKWAAFGTHMASLGANKVRDTRAVRSEADMMDLPYAFLSGTGNGRCEVQRLVKRGKMNERNSGREK